MLFRIIALLVFVVTGVLYSGLPASTDQLELDYLGWLIMDGGVPYVDFIDNNWPGAIFLHIFSTKIFGNSLHSWRILDYLLMGSCLMFLADLLRQTFGKKCAAWSIILYPCLFASVGFIFAGQRDLVAANLYWIAIWAHWRAYQQDRPSWKILTGVIIAFVTLVKPTTLAIAPLLILHGLWLSLRQNKFRAFLRLEMISIISSFFILLIAFSIVLFIGTPLDALLESVWYFNLYPQGAGSISLHALLRDIFTFHVVSWHWLTIVSVITVSWIFVFQRREKIDVTLLFIFVWIAGWISLWSQGRSFWYHYAIIWTGMLPFLFIGLGKLTEFLLVSNSRFKKLFSLVIILIVILGTAKKYVYQYKNTALWFSHRISNELYYDSFFTRDGLSIGDIYRIVQDIKNEIKTGDTLLVIGDESIANYLLKKRNSMSFYYFPIFTEVRNPIEMAEKWNKIFISDIKEDNSPFAIVHMEFLLNEPPSHNNLTKSSLEFTRTLLNERYEVVKQYNQTILLRRRGYDVVR
jgi:hypothetical protein